MNTFKAIREDAKLAVGAVKDGLSSQAYLICMAIVCGCLAIALSITLVAMSL